MFFSLFKNKWFWVVWLILSLAGAIVGYMASEKHKEQLELAENAICVEFRDLKHPSIWGIQKLKYKDQYLAVMLDSSIKTYNIPLARVIENNQSVKILEYSEDRTLTKIAVIREESTAAKPDYEELWLWSRFIKKK